MVGVDGSSPFAPTKFGSENKHLAETPGAFFLAVPKKVPKSTLLDEANARLPSDLFCVEIIVRGSARRA
jgi:hypothetical protein